MSGPDFTQDWFRIGGTTGLPGVTTDAIAFSGSASPPDGSITWSFTGSQ